MIFLQKGMELYMPVMVDPVTMHRKNMVQVVLINDKKYMLSLMWNAPMEAFNDTDQFFHGVGVDRVYLPFHKANQFLGMKSLNTFIVNDVIKVPNVAEYENKYRQHLLDVLPNGWFF